MKVELNIKNILTIGLPILFFICLIIILISYSRNKNENFENAKINLALNKASNAEKSFEMLKRTVEAQNDGCAPKYRGANNTINSKPDAKRVPLPAASCGSNIDYGQVPKEKERNKPSKNTKDSSNQEKIIEVVLVYADWCGYSRKAEPEFDKLLEEMNDTEYKGHTLKIKKYEEKKNTPEFKEMVGDVKIRGFPTIVVQTSGTTFKDNETYTFNAIEYKDMKAKLSKVIDDNY